MGNQFGRTTSGEIGPISSFSKGPLAHTQKRDKIIVVSVTDMTNCLFYFNEGDLL